MALIKKHSGALDEMAIVDIFTRLIFDADIELNDGESLVVELLRQVEPNVAHASRRDISEYLRATGVDEMIQLVSRIKSRLEHQQGIVASQQQAPSSSLYH